MKRRANSPVVSARSGRALAWAGALALVVLLAVAGMPAAAATIAPTTVELCDGCGSLVPGGVPPRAAAVHTPLLRRFAAAAPRAPARSRRIDEGGIPAPRAPTV